MYQICVIASSVNGEYDEERTTIIRKEKDGWNIKFGSQKPSTPLLDTINYPLHMKNLSKEDLEQLAAELRADIVHTVSNVGGHLSSSLGVVELTVALHHVFNAPEDKIIWDVGHQVYPHKILTGRRSAMHTIKKTSGLSGFPKRDESIYDAFGTGHSSTSISAGLGMAVARDLLGKNNNVISVIGDGAMTAGQAYEAMNNAGFLDANMIIILNDNKQVSLPTATLDGPATPVGALSRNLSKIQASTKFRKLREAAKVVHDVDLQKLPVRFVVDRAGLVGADGPTHHGVFDTTYMACLPNMVVMAPADEAELMHMVATAAAIDDRPSCLRISRENGIGAILPLNNKGTPLEIGKGKVVIEGSRVAILGFGSMVQRCMQAAQMLKSLDISVTVADARFCKPLDTDLIKLLAKEHEFLITVEEGSIGGFGSHVSQYLSISGILDGPLKWRAMMLPDRYIDHGSQQDQIEEAGLSSKHIAATILSLL
ncbi:hypothetical protein RIF29_36388 [Crotalaria pallida]|uniref:1-deoxy-D-xylulose-5-phosphate synthase n=1 Tax=Crotalaria pallida TaxID=3830 RepID=A0AAN9EGM1_CROPI